MRIELRRKIPRWAVPLRAKARYKGASGGRAAGRSHFFAEEAVEAMVCDPSLRFVCIREVQRALKFSAKSLVEAKIYALGVRHLFDILTTEIRRRGGMGVMIFEGMQDHTAESIKSLEGFGRAWVEEAHSISERSLNLLLPTIRSPGSELWFGWNPDQPTDAVDKFFRSRPEGAVHVEATYEDNPFLPDEMRTEAQRMLKADPETYEHVWGGGYFMGGSGRVYSTFINRPHPDGNIHEDLEDTGGDILVGMDFNVDPMSLVIAVRAGDECHVLDALEIKTSNTEEAAAELRERYPKPRRVIICPDPSGKARKTSAPVGQTDFTILKRYGFEVRAPNQAPPVVDRENNAKAMYHDIETGRRRCLVHPKADALRMALANLKYKEGTSQRDKKSGFDHICFAAGTPVMTPAGEVPIEQIRPGDMVLTRHGFFPVAVAGMTHPSAEVWRVEASNGARLTVTPGHPFWTVEKGFAALRELTQADTLFACQRANPSSIAESPSAATPTPRDMRIGCTSHRARLTGWRAWIASTARFGRTPTARSQMGATFTIATATRSTTTSPTWRAFRRPVMSATTRPNPSGFKAGALLLNLTRCATSPLSGTAPTRGGSGIASMAVRRGRAASRNLSRVRGAEKAPRSSSWAAGGTSARRRVSRQSGAPLAPMTRTASAPSAAPASESTDTGRLAPVLGRAAHISAIEPAGRAPVYNLTVDGPHEYFAGGILVSNCDALDYLLWHEFNVLPAHGPASTFEWSI